MIGSGSRKGIDRTIWENVIPGCIDEDSIQLAESGGAACYSR
jgi:hypothetical protein